MARHDWRLSRPQKELLPLALTLGRSNNQALARPVEDVLTDVDYKHCATLVSLETCQYAHENIHNQVKQEGTEWLENNVAVLKRRRLCYKAEFGVNPHPGRLFQAVANQSAAACAKCIECSDTPILRYSGTPHTHHRHHHHH